MAYTLCIILLIYIIICSQFTALQTYKSELGETNPVTLRNVSNLQLLLLEEAEGLEKSEAKPMIDANKSELEETLESVPSLNDSWTYRHH